MNLRGSNFTFQTVRNFDFLYRTSVAQQTLGVETRRPERVFADQKIGVWRVEGHVFGSSGRFLIESARVEFPVSRCTQLLLLVHCLCCTGNFGRGN